MLQTIVEELFVSDGAVSSAACSASASAARRCAASRAAAKASGLGLERRISGCRPRYRFSSSEPGSVESEGKAADLGFLLSSFTNQITPTPAVILAQRLRGVLSAGKFDFAFGLGRQPVAGCRSISPCAHGLQNMAVTDDARAFQDKRGVNPSVDSDDEADFYSPAVGGRSEKRIRRSQGLWRANIFASGLQTDVGHIDELGSAGQRF